MSQTLINAIRKSRQTRITVGKYTFTVRRPTIREYLEFERYLSDEIDEKGNKIVKIKLEVEHLSDFVLDWSGVTGLDLSSSADGNQVPFDTDLFMAWVVDQPAVWPIIINAIFSAFNSYLATREDLAKN